MAPRIAALAILTLLLPACSALRVPVTLKPGQSITRPITLSGPALEIRILDLPEGAVAHLTASQFEIDLALVTDTGLRIDRGDAGLETIYLPGNTNPATTLRIIPATQYQPRQGRTTVTLDWIRKKATPSDRTAITAQQDEVRARGLVEKKTAATLAAAVETYAGACRLWHESGDLYSEARCLVPFGGALEKQGRHAEASQHYERSLPILAESADRASFLDTHKIWINIGGHIGEQRAGLPELHAYRRQLEEVGDRRAIALILGSIASNVGLPAEPERYNEALALYQQALQMQQSLGDKSMEASVWIEIAGLQTSHRRFAEADATYQRAVKLATESGDPALELDVLVAADHFYGSQRLPAKQIPLLRRLQEINEKHGDQSGWLWATDHLAAAEADAGDAERAWTHVEQARAARQQIASRNQAHPSALFEEGAAPLGAILNPKMLASGAGVEQRIWTYIDSSRAQFVASGIPPRLRDVTSALPPDALLIEHNAPPHEESSLWTWAITAGQGIRLYPGPSSGASIVALADRVADHWARRRPETPQSREDRLQLAQTLLAPLRDFPNAKKLIIVQDERLHRVPFAALPHPFRSDGSAIGDHLEVILTPSAQGVIAARQKQQQTAAPSPIVDLALITDPVVNRRDTRLPHSPTTADSQGDWISSARSVGVYQDGVGFARLIWAGEERNRLLEIILKTSPTTSRSSSRIVDLSGFDANVDRVASTTAAGARFIHFATHGIADLARPSRSGLVFSMWDAAGRPVEGYWRFDQIATSHLPQTELVTLGACETAIGRAHSNSHAGIPSLSHAFLRAGARRVISTLWKVDDAASALLMVEFYRILLQEHENRPAVALWRAQQKISKTPHRTHPYFWAGFVLIGDWNPIR